MQSASQFKGLLQDGYDPLSSMDPANIESIEVLKDADATAIYGSGAQWCDIDHYERRGPQRGNFF